VQPPIASASLHREKLGVAAGALAILKNLNQWDGLSSREGERFYFSSSVSAQSLRPFNMSPIWVTS